MDANFWHQRWEQNQIAFHENRANPLLVKNHQRLSLPPGGRWFVPLCGKSLDIHWLLANGYSVAGAELSPIAIDQLFSELGVKPKVRTRGKLKHYQADNIDIFVGDIFDLSGADLGKVDGIYDRAALVALPEAMRARYTAHLVEITRGAPQLLACFVYDQNLQPGPPFSVSDREVEEHYRAHYDLELLSSEEVPGGLKGKCPAKENVWLLTKIGSVR